MFLLVTTHDFIFFFEAKRSEVWLIALLKVSKIVMTDNRDQFIQHDW